MTWRPTLTLVDRMTDGQTPVKTLPSRLEMNRMNACETCANLEGILCKGKGMLEWLCMTFLVLIFCMVWLSLGIYLLGSVSDESLQRIAQQQDTASVMSFNSCNNSTTSRHVSNHHLGTKVSMILLWIFMNSINKSNKDAFIMGCQR